MNLVVNGEEREIPEGTTVAGILVLFDLSKQRVAVEKNGEIVTKNEYESAVLAEGDRLEIVQFVGGG